MRSLSWRMPTMISTVLVFGARPRQGGVLEDGPREEAPTQDDHAHAHRRHPRWKPDVPSGGDHDQHADQAGNEAGVLRVSWRHAAVSLAAAPGKVLIGLAREPS